MCILYTLFVYLLSSVYQEKHTCIVVCPFVSIKHCTIIVSCQYSVQFFLFLAFVFIYKNYNNNFHLCILRSRERTARYHCACACAVLITQSKKRAGRKKKVLCTCIISSETLPSQAWVSMEWKSVLWCVSVFSHIGKTVSKIAMFRIW